MCSADLLYLSGQDSGGGFGPCLYLRGAGFTSTEQLTRAINDFVSAYNDNAAPFVWRKREVKVIGVGHFLDETELPQAPQVAGDTGFGQAR